MAFQPEQNQEQQFPTESDQDSQLQEGDGQERGLIKKTLVVGGLAIAGKKAYDKFQEHKHHKEQEHATNVSTTTNPNAMPNATPTGPQPTSATTAHPNVTPTAPQPTAPQPTNQV